MDHLPPAEKRTMPTDLPVTFLHERKGTDKSLVLFLHGYTDSASSFLRRAFRSGGQLGHSWLAPNGPFPLPVRDGENFKEAYAWYFWEYSKNKMVIPPAVAVGLLKNLIRDLGYEEVPKVIVGFSQGGFLAPYLFRELRNLKGCIAVGAAFREEDFPEINSFPLVAIHGSEDKIITAARSRQSFEKLMKTGKIRGEFKEFSGLAHTLDRLSSAFLLEKVHEMLK